MCVGEGGRVAFSVLAPIGQRRRSEPLEPELQVVLGCPVWVPASEPRPSATKQRSYGAISPGLLVLFPFSVGTWG